MKTYTSWIIIGVAVVLILGWMIRYSTRPGQYDEFATCIKDSGATFFGAFWCPHCQKEKALFGKSAKYLPYTECSTPDGKGQTDVCKNENIATYPTWQFKDDTRKTGTLSLEELALFTGCPLVKN